MTFHILQNSTTADAADENDNFYHIGQGSRLPMGGASLTSTDSVYDLGSSTYRWNNLYCNNINLESDGNIWTLEAETTLTDTTTSIEFTGLNGDVSKDFMIFGYITNPQTATSAIRLYINGDSATANYGYQRIFANASSIAATRVTVNSGIIFSETGPNGTGFTRLDMNAQSGFQRSVINDFVRASTNTTIDFLFAYCQIWNNTVDTITSLTFQCIAGKFGTGTNIQVWGRV